MQAACTLNRTSNNPRRSGWALYLILLLAVVAGAGCPAVCRAQQAPVPVQQPIQSATEFVKVDASVLDNQGNFVGGLLRNNFRVLDNGAEQPVAFFAPVEAPAQILVMIETSPAVYLIHNQHLVAAYALLDGLEPEDEVAVVTYDQSPRVILPFTPQKSALLAALGQVQYTIGMSDLNCYDSISGVLDWLGPGTGKRALVLLTTGLDSSPPGRWDALVRRLRAQDVVIFSVALGGSIRGIATKKPKKGAAKSAGQQTETESPSESASATGFARADSALRSLATITGGRAYFPESDQDFVRIYHEIASALRHQYVLGVAPAHDGQFHPLTVEVLDAGGQPMSAPSRKPEYRVLAREGYLAPGP
jgi:Ca-activated chloride channel homolog